VLAAAVIVLAVLGTAPAFAGLPEWLLLAGVALSPVIVCGVAGFLARRTGRGLGAAAVPAVIAGAIGGMAAGLSFLGLHQIFYDTVSTEPEKVLNFQKSGLSSMREYLVRTDLLSVALSAALGAAGGGLVGAIGAAVGGHSDRAA